MSAASISSVSNSIPGVHGDFPVPSISAERGRMKMIKSKHMLVAVLLGGSALAVPALVAPGYAQDLAVTDEAEITQELNEERAAEAFLQFDTDVDGEALLPTQEELSEVLDNGEVDVSSYFAPRNRELVRELLERRT